MPAKAQHIKVFKLRPQKKNQEIMNGITHGVSALLGIGAMGPLILLAFLKGNFRHVIGMGVFGLALVFLFCASTVMHIHRSTGAVKAIYGFLDHVGICVVIAGTYTPFCLVTLHGPLGYSLLAIVWAMAIGGIVLSFVYGERFMQHGNWVYLIMGWLIAIAIVPLYQNLGPWGLGLLVGGGFTYSIGVLVLATKPHYHYHAIWHIFVTAGALLHLVAILLFVLPDMR